MVLAKWGPNRALVIFGLALSFGPLVLRPDRFALSLLILVGIYFLVCIGLILIFGFAGQLALTHAAFFGLGAYASALTFLRTGGLLPVGLALAVLIPAGVAFLIGKPLLKLRHFYLGIASIAIGQIAAVLFVQAQGVTGGATGLLLPEPSIGGILFTGTRYYYLVWAIAFAAFWFTHNLVNSRVGRALRAIAQGEIAATACGIDVATYNLQMYVLGSAFAGLGGALFVHHLTYISPYNFEVSFALLLVIMIAVGGMYSLWGALIGAIFVTVAPVFLAGYREYGLLIYGLAFLFVILALPHGVVGFIEQSFNRLRTWRSVSWVRNARKRAKPSGSERVI